MSDPIADMISRLRNALAVEKSFVLVPYSSMKHSALSLLLDEGYIKSVESVEKEGRKFLSVGLKYYSGAPVIKEIKRISKPGCRVYSRVDMLKPVKGGLGLLVLSTSAGIMSDARAREGRVGGEILFEVF